MLLDCLFVGCGGFVGSVLRYCISFLEIGTKDLPLATLGINVIGSFAIMFFSEPVLRMLSADNRLGLFIRIGLCGGFTTFSTFSAETLTMFDSGNYVTGLLYVSSTIVLCITAAFLGKVASSIVAIG